MGKITKFIEHAGNAYFDHKSTKVEDKILIIESDDWGSIRTKNIKSLEILNNISPEVKKDPYTQLDNISSSDDLNALYEVLNSVKDMNGNPACITFNVNTANPDFERIKKDGFERFYYEPFTKTIERIHGKEVWNLWEQGFSEGLIKPQLHGREHLHALQWLSELREGNQDLLKAFEQESFGIPYKPLLTGRRKNLQAAMDHYGIKGEDEFQKKWLLDGAEIFSEIFGYHSDTFIPPAYIWHSRINRHLKNIGIKAIQGIKLQYQPRKSGYKRIFHYIGEKNMGLTHSVRNTFFEPSAEPMKDWSDITISGIDLAFKKNQPAIIGSHRINFIGNLDEKNRSVNLKMLQNILVKTIQKHPDTVFLNSSELRNYLL